MKVEREDYSFPDITLSEAAKRLKTSSAWILSGLELNTLDGTSAQQ